MLRKLIVASNNLHKIAEISEILGPKWSVFPARHFVPDLTWDETGATFLENARIKLAALQSKLSNPRDFCLLADDSGLCVDALNGEPGVYSSSYGGIEADHERSIDRLLKGMNEVNDENRGAHFYCLLLLVDERGEEFKFEGKCYGKIAKQRCGQNGFGYDAVFFVEQKGKTMAELAEPEKNAISHRGAALAQLKGIISSP